jgi:hypothetical protein
VYGAVSGHPEVFVASLPLYELIKRIYVSRAVLRTDASPIESVKVSVQGTPLTGQSQAALREAASGIFPDRAASLGGDVGRPDLEILMSLSEGGPTKRIVCRPLMGSWRKCATPDVKSVFDVHPSALSGLVPPLAAAAPPSAEAGASIDAGGR